MQTICQMDDATFVSKGCFAITRNDFINKCVTQATANFLQDDGTYTYHAQWSTENAPLRLSSTLTSFIDPMIYISFQTFYMHLIVYIQ